MAECLIKRRYNDGGTPTIVSWQNGTDAEIAAMIAAADAGQIDLSDYWSIGDERTVHLDAMTAGDAFTTAMAAQDVVLVLMDTGTASGYKDVNNKPVNFVVGQKDCLTGTGMMNASSTATSVGSWNGSDMRADLNNKYYNALPATFRTCLKQFKTITAQTYNGSTNQISNDYIALFAEKEIFGERFVSNSTEANALAQIEYYKTTSHRIKQVNGSNSNWWGRSLSSTYTGYFCGCFSYGDYAQAPSYTDYGISPFMCI